MARKFDRYGRNRQFRRNPTRSRKFFPYQLPFQNDFRLLSANGTQVSAETAARWRQVVADITNPNKRKRDEFEDDGYYRFMQYSQSPAKNARRSIGAAVGDAAFSTVLARAAQGYLKKDVMEVALRTALATGMYSI